MKKKLNKIVLLLLLLALAFCAMTACNPSKNDKSIYQMWLDDGHSGTESDFLEWLRGDAGSNGSQGLSAYQIWLNQGHKGSEEDFLKWIKGQDGTNGQNGTDGKGLSAYETYLKYFPDYTGTEEEWINDLANGKLIRLDVIFNSMGGDQIPTVKTQKGDKVIKPIDPEKYRSVFMGWYKESDCINKWNFDNDVIESDTTLYAKWRDAEILDLLDFTLIEDDTEYAVSKGTLYIDENGDGTGGAVDVIIPAEYNGLPVTTVPNYGFSSNTVGYGLTGIALPDTIKSIGEGAFAFCGRLTEISIPDSVASIGSQAFNNCKELTSITFGQDSMLESIGDMLFHYCVKLQTIELPKSLRYIEASNFSFCDSLTSITIENGNPYYKVEDNCIIRLIDNYLIDGCIADTIPNGIKGIGLSAFFGNGKLISILIPNGVKEIGEYAFIACFALTDIILPEGLISIGKGAFYGNNSIKSIVIPSTVKNIGESIFTSLSNLSTVFYSGKTEAEWNKIDITERNDILTDSDRYYYSESIPTDGNYWRYIDGVPTVWDLTQDYFEVSYGITTDSLNYEIGTIEGESKQIVVSGQDAKAVKAVPAQGYQFVGWNVIYDNDYYSFLNNYYFEYIPSQRHDTGITRHIHASAIFIKTDEVYFAGGDGSDSNPYLIQTYNQLLRTKFFPDSNYKLIADIDLNGQRHTPMFTAWGEFNGTFDGNNKTIQNFKVELSYHRFPSLFGVIGTNGTVKNLNILDYQIILPSGFDTESYSFLSAGSVAGISFGELKNINTSGKIIGNNINYNYIVAGGLCGQAYNKEIFNCSSEVDIKIEFNHQSEQLYALIIGGLFGICGSDIKDASSSGKIEVFGYHDGELYGGHFGGLVGLYDFEENSKQAVQIINANADVDIICKNAARVGGFIAYIGLSDTVFLIEDCYATGDIDYAHFAGGFICDFAAGQNSKLENCYATGNINAENSAGGFLMKVQIIGFGTGGVIVSKTIDIVSCYATGDVYAKTYAAGFIQGIYNSNISYCYSTSDVTVLNSGAGFIRIVINTDLEYCYSSGTITGSHVAGFTSFFSESKAYRCYTTVDAIGTGETSNAFGFTYICIDSQIIECFAAGDLYGSQRIYGFTRYMDGSSKIIDCYSLCDIFITSIDADSIVTVSGFIGQVSAFMNMDEKGIISNCYYAGNIQGGVFSDNSVIAGFIADADTRDLDCITIINAYWYKSDTNLATDSITNINPKYPIPDSWQITVCQDINDIYNLADIFNANQDSPVWVNVPSAPPALSFMFE